jgi:hypothetical protein
VCVSELAIQFKKSQDAPTRKTIVQANLRLMQFIITGRRRIRLRRITRRHLIISPTRINKNFRLFHRHTFSFYNNKKAGWQRLTSANPTSLACFTGAFVCSTGLIQACEGVIKSFRSVNVCRPRYANLNQGCVLFKAEMGGSTYKSTRKCHGSGGYSFINTS